MLETDTQMHMYKQYIRWH